MLTAYCPCVTFGQVAEVLDEGKTSRKKIPVIFYFLFYFLLYKKHDDTNLV